MMESYLMKFWALIGISVACGILGIFYALYGMLSVYPILSLLLMLVAIIWMLDNACRWNPEGT
jgi:uncharacterized membrane protein